MKKRRAHILAGNKGNLRPHHVIFFDTETRAIPIAPNENKHVLRLGWACYYRPPGLGVQRKPQWFSFSTPPQFWEFVENLCKDDKKVYLVAHNVAFDLRIVEGFSYLKANGWKEQFTYDKGLTTILRFTRPKQSLEILSTTNFFGFSLKQLGEMVGLDKKEVDFKTASDSQLSEYCHRDVEIILEAWKLWIDFLDTHELGTFRRTISSQAFASYRHRFMTIPISIHSDMSVCRFEREAYRGGRTECFKVGVFPFEDYYYVDVNGMYAHQMATQRYPYRLAGHKPTLPTRSLTNKLRNFAVIARVDLNTDQPAFVYRHNDRNVYPIGRFETVLTTPDLLYASELGAIERVGEIAWYHQDFIFRPYVHYFTTLKTRYEREGNTAFRGIAKLYINALYGKFGQTDIKSKDIQSLLPDNSPDGWLLWLVYRLFFPNRLKHQHVNMGVVDHDTGRWIRPKRGGEKTTDKAIPEETYNSFPAIVAHVTAYARHHLWQLILKAGRKNCFYCDTDSLIVNQRGLDNLKELLHPTNPGYLKIEKKGKNLEIYAPKDYVIADRLRRKGIRGNAMELEGGGYCQDQFLGLSGALRRGEPDLVTIKSVVKVLKREIKTGLVQKDGWVNPLRFPL